MSPPDPSERVEDPRRGVALGLGASLFAAIFLLLFQSASRAAAREPVVIAMLASSAMFNFGFALTRRRAAAERHVSRKVTALTIAVFVLTTIGGNIGVAGALERLGPGITGTILQTQVFLVALGGRLFLGEKLSVAFVFGIALAFGGFVVLGVADPGDGRIDPWGVGFAMLASTAFGGMLLWTRAVIHRIEPVTVNVARLSLAVVVMVLLPGRFAGVLELPGAVWLAAIGAAACGPFISRLMLMFATEHIGASRLKLITLVSPVIAFGLEWAVLGSPPALHELFAGALILAGVLLPLAVDAKKRPPADT